MARSYDDSPGFSGNRQRHPRDVTRLRILNQAHVLLLTQGVPEPMEVRLAAVLDRLGLTTGAAYNIWSSQEEFRRDLTVHVAQNGVFSLPVEPALEKMATMDETDAARFMLDEAVRLQLEAPDERVSHFLASVGDASPDLDAERKRIYEQARKGIARLLAGWLDHFGRLPADPYSIDDLIDVVMSTINGLALASRFRPNLEGSDNELPTRLLGDTLMNITTAA